MNESGIIAVDRQTILQFLIVHDFLQNVLKTTEYKNILSSFQILIDYIQKENYNDNEEIHKIIRSMPDYIKIYDKVRQFFSNQSNKIFSVNKLMSIYNIIELECWEQFKKNLNDQYKFEIKDDDKKKLRKNSIQN